MKRGKDEDKMLGPMFPRLHVNDTDKGGPRAPPRNKMALYEQLSIPSQKFAHAVHQKPNANLVPQSSQGGVNERCMFFPQQLPAKPQSENQYSQYSDLSTPSTQRNKLDEDDFQVPIFVHSTPSQERVKYASEFQIPEERGVLEHSMNLQEKSEKEDNSNSKPLSNFSFIKKMNQADSSLCHEQRDGDNFSMERLKSNDSVQQELCAKSQPAIDKSCSSPRARAISSEECGIESRENEPFDDMSETSIVDSISELDITPDDVVGVIGQNHFWKARRAIVNQQRAFSVQVFELHRLIKVQRSIATSPHLLQDDTVSSSKPTNPSPEKKLPLKYPIKALPHIAKKKDDLEKPTQSSVSTCSDNNSRPLCINQPNGPQWLIPVMSPSEGLVYKPYPGPTFEPGFAGPAYGGAPTPNAVMGNFLTPAYGAPAPHPPYQIGSFPSFHTAPPHGYFHPYPIVNTPSFPGSSFEQVNRPYLPNQPNFKVQHRNLSEIEVQASTASSPRNTLPLFPGPNSSPRTPEPERPSRVIKVVPHNARTATESVARIFQSIQEERKQV